MSPSMMSPLMERRLNDHHGSEKSNHVLRAIARRVTAGTRLRRAASQPEMVAPTCETLGQVPAGALGVAGAEGGLEQGVVEDVALRPGAAQLDDPRPQRLDALDGAAIIARRKRVQALQQGQQHVAHEAGL